MSIVSKLLANGTFMTSVTLDEVTQTRIGQTQNNIFSSEFDEITINPIVNGLAKRETFDGKLLISGYFDETTGL